MRSLTTLVAVLLVLNFQHGNSSYLSDALRKEFELAEREKFISGPTKILAEAGLLTELSVLFDNAQLRFATLLCRLSSQCKLDSSNKPKAKPCKLLLIHDEFSEYLLRISALISNIYHCKIDADVVRSRLQSEIKIGTDIVKISDQDTKLETFDAIVDVIKNISNLTASEVKDFKSARYFYQVLGKLPELTTKINELSKQLPEICNKPEKGDQIPNLLNGVITQLDNISNLVFNRTQ